MFEIYIPFQQRSLYCMQIQDMDCFMVTSQAFYRAQTTFMIYKKLEMSQWNSLCFEFAYNIEGATKKIYNFHARVV